MRAFLLASFMSLWTACSYAAIMNLDKKTADFLAWCATDVADCNETIGGIGRLLHGCHGDRREVTPQDIEAVKGWLASHAKPDWSAVTQIGPGFIAIWNCK